MKQHRLGEQPLDPALLSHGGPIAKRPSFSEEIVGGKGSVFYRAHSYHTKVPPEGIARAIEHYTDPGDVVLDPFCGSGMTGIACLLTGRRGVLSDLSPAAVHIARNYVNRPDPEAFESAGQELLADLAGLETALYGTSCAACGSTHARIEYTVWSDVHGCPGCQTELLFWDVALDESKSRIDRVIHCSTCRSDWKKKDLVWLRLAPVLVSVGCRECKKREQRPLTEPELESALGFTRSSIPYWYPTDAFDDWREMWRRQHAAQGLETAADFYTPRNLWAMAAIWARTGATAEPGFGDPLRFAFTSIANRASRRYQWNSKRPTNVLSSTMYVASLSYEFNVFSLLRRKLKALRSLFEATAVLSGQAEVHQSEAQRLGHVPDRSIDYVFTDPPFGSNIFYGDSSFLWEAWLQDQTNLHLETVVNRSLPTSHGGKDVSGYEKLMTEAFEEVARVLRPGAWSSVMFHNSDDEVWSALQRSVEVAGFEIGGAVAFDKSQPSFKGVKAITSGERVPAFDLVLHLRARTSKRRHSPNSATPAYIRTALGAHLAKASRKRRSTAYMHSLVLRLLLEGDFEVEGWTYASVEDLCSESFLWRDGAWHVDDPAKSST